MSDPGSVPRYTSKGEGFRTAEEIEALRPIREVTRPVTKPARKTPSASGRLCPICQQPFYDLATFGEHIWAEAQPLVRRQKQRQQRSRDRYVDDPEYRARIAAQSRQWREDHPERFNDLVTAWRERTDYNGKRRARMRDDPEYRARELERKRRYRERKRAGRA